MGAGQSVEDQKQMNLLCQMMMKSHNVKYCALLEEGAFMFPSELPKPDNMSLPAITNWLMLIYTTPKYKNYFNNLPINQEVLKDLETNGIGLVKLPFLPNPAEAIAKVITYAITHKKQEPIIQSAEIIGQGEEFIKAGVIGGGCAMANMYFINVVLVIIVIILTYFILYKCDFIKDISNSGQKLINPLLKKEGLMAYRPLIT